MILKYLSLFVQQFVLYILNIHVYCICKFVQIYLALITLMHYHVCNVWAKKADLFKEPKSVKDKS